jgi:hypothetical protein
MVSSLVWLLMPRGGVEPSVFDREGIPVSVMADRSEAGSSET